MALWLFSEIGWADEGSPSFEVAVSEQDRIENCEPRWRTIGRVGSCLLLLVAHTVRLEDEVIEIVRIISARRVDRKERKRYEQG